MVVAVVITDHSQHEKGREMVMPVIIPHRWHTHSGSGHKPPASQYQLVASFGRIGIENGLASSASGQFSGGFVELGDAVLLPPFHDALEPEPVVPSTVHSLARHALGWSHLPVT